MKTIFVVHEKKSMILLVFCSLNLYHCYVIVFSSCFSLFQIVESSGDLLNRLGFSNVERHDSCSALIKVTLLYFVYEKKTNEFHRFFQTTLIFLFLMPIGVITRQC